MVRISDSGRTALRRTLISVIALAGTPVGAQEVTGPTRALVINGVVDTLYDSNVLRSTNFGPAPLAHQDDYRVSPSVSAGLLARPRPHRADRERARRL